MYRPSDYAQLIRSNEGSAYRKPVILFLVPDIQDPYVDTFIASVSANEMKPPQFDVVFARIVQDQQISMAIETHKPRIVVTTGDHWLNLLLHWLPLQRSRQLHGAFIPLDGTTILYPLEDLPLGRRKRLSGGGSTSGPNSPRTTTTTAPSSPERSTTHHHHHHQSLSSSPPGSRPLASALTRRSLSDDAIMTHPTDIVSTVEEDVVRLFSTLSQRVGPVLQPQSVGVQCTSFQAVPRHYQPSM